MENKAAKLFYCLYFFEGLNIINLNHCFSFLKEPVDSDFMIKIGMHEKLFPSMAPIERH